MDFSRAREALSAGRPADAEGVCRALLGQMPHDLPTWLLLPECLLAQGKLSAADGLTADLLARIPDQPDLLVARALTLSQFGGEEQAIDLLDQAIDIRLDHPRGHEVLASLLERRHDPRPRYEVSVITPTIGTAFLRQAIESVQRQRYPFVRHFIVVDGPECHDRVIGLLPSDPRHPIHVLPLPLNVGGGGFCGHRVYGAMPFLVPSRFVSFLDEDNWFADDHLETLMQAVTANGLAWAYSLRTIVSVEGAFMTTDDCESLGGWPTWNDPQFPSGRCQLLCIASRSGSLR
jgi:tetratricopeptide (TPR) repeat protein